MHKFTRTVRHTTHTLRFETLTAPDPSIHFYLLHFAEILTQHAARIPH